MSSRNAETIALPAIRLRISPTPIGLSPGFLSKGIKRQDRKASSESCKSGTMHSFRITAAKDLHMSTEL